MVSNLTHFTLNHGTRILFANAFLHCRFALYVLFTLSMMFANAEHRDFIDRTYLGELPVAPPAPQLGRTACLTLRVEC